MCFRLLLLLMVGPVEQPSHTLLSLLHISIKIGSLKTIYFTDTDCAREPYRYVFLFQQPTEKSHSIVFTI